MSKTKLTYVGWYVARHQLQVQIAMLEQSISELHLSVQPNWVLIDEMSAAKSNIRTMLQQLEEKQPPRGNFLKRLVQNAIIKTYHWAMEGRLEIGGQN